MSRQIVVTSTCQTGGIAAALQALLPTDSIIPRPYPLELGEDELLEQLSRTSVWVYMPKFLCDFMERHDVQRKFPSLRTVNICSLLFWGFHPDLCYLKSRSTGTYIRQPYNSAIGYWAFKHGLDLDETLPLFNARMYRALGYFDHWAPSAEQLRLRFDEYQSDIDFARYFLSIKRHGNFMHTINHPKPEALVAYARQIAFKIDGAEEVFDRDVDINDGLNNEIWPLYPEIADALSLPGGSYVWRTGGKYFSGIRSFLEYSYEGYRQDKLDPQDLYVDADETVLDRVLKAHTGR
jgi:hypothetical protein